MWKKIKDAFSQRNRGKEPKISSSMLLNILLWLFFIWSVAGFVNNYNVKPTGEITYSQFVRNVNNGNINHITILDYSNVFEVRTQTPIETRDYINAKEEFRRYQENDNLTWWENAKKKMGLGRLVESNIEKMKEIYYEKRYYVKHDNFAQSIAQRILPLKEKSIEEGEKTTDVKTESVDKEAEKTNTKTVSTANGDVVIPVNDNMEIEVVSRSAQARLIAMILGIIPTLGLFVLLFWIIIRMQENSGLMQKTHAKEAEIPEGIKLDDVRGIEDNLKQEITEILDFINEPEKYKRFNVKCPKGVLMVGPPGVGKTLLAKAMASEANVPFFYRSGSDLENPYVGMSAQTIRNLFKAAKKHEKAIIFIDEIDAIGSRSGIHQHNTGLVNALLTEMDGFEDASGVIVVAATNNPEKLDPALLREGRFDRKVAIPLPSEKGRKDILSFYVEKHKSSLAEDIDIDVLAKLTIGYSGAALASLINEAAIEAIRENNNVINQNHIMRARDKKIMGVPFLNFSQSEEQRRITAYHEAGHAIAALLLDKAMKLYKVSILPRSNSLGVTVSVPLEEKHNYSRQELLNRIKVLYAGRVAEEIFFNEITTGASNDIEVATNIAQRMITEFGMHKDIGMQKVENNTPLMKKVDDLRSTMLEELYQSTLTLLTENKDKVERIAIALLEKEEISSEEISELLEVKALPAPEIQKEEKKGLFGWWK